MTCTNELINVGSINIKDNLESYELKIGRISKLIKSMFTPQSTINGVIIQGSPGIGKSHTTEQCLSKIPDITYKIIKGHITPLQLYELLRENNMSNNVLVFDDADAVFSDIKSLNILKAATELKSIRSVSWESSRVQEPIFEYQGKVIILTNAKLNNSVHYQALVDRCFIYDPKISQAEKISKIVAMAREQALVDVDAEISSQVIRYFTSSIDLAEKLSLRLFIKTCNLAKATDEWIDLLEAMEEKC